MRTPRPFVFLFFAPILLVGQSHQSQAEPFPARELSSLRQQIESSTVFATGFTGFWLGEAESGNTLLDYNADQHFTPASNVKLFTYYVAHKVLAGQAPAVWYEEFPDYIRLRGTGYPLLLHPDFADYDALLPWLQTQQKPIYLVGIPEETLPRYGLGWSWDDYNDSYVYERSNFPVFGNRLTVRREKSELGFQVWPELFTNQLKFVDEGPTAVRSENHNDFRLSERLLVRSTIDLQRPLRMDTGLVKNCLAEGLGHQAITILPPESSSRFSFAAGKQGFASPLLVNMPDTVYRKLLRNSDNFLAEQLLIQAAAHRYGTLDIAPLLSYARDTLLPELKLQPRQWVDGSGLSRYNQFTPRQIGQLLTRMYQEIGPDTLAGVLPAGGESGTLAQFFPGATTPYLWAKTGSLRNVLCVSGMLRTSSGRWLIFSFMHNHFPGRSRAHYREMEQVMGWIHDNL